MTDSDVTAHGSEVPSTRDARGLSPVAASGRPLAAHSVIGRHCAAKQSTISDMQDQVMTVSLPIGGAGGASRSIVCGSGVFAVVGKDTAGHPALRQLQGGPVRSVAEVGEGVQQPRDVLRSSVRHGGG